MEELLLEIITPEKTVLKEKVESIVVPSFYGELGILKNHAPAVLELQIGRLKFKKDGRENYVFIAGGFLKVEKNRVIILTPAGELKEEIDIKRAEMAKKRAEERLKSKSGDVDILRAEISLKKAISRIKIASQNR
jgi:F-type H+-transporting ATPase subunit epsilon